MLAHVSQYGTTIKYFDIEAAKSNNPLKDDPILGCTATGNTYRHLDTGTKQFGRDIRLKLKACGVELNSDEGIELALLVCVCRIDGYDTPVYELWWSKYGNKNHGDLIKMPATLKDFESFYKSHSCLALKSKARLLNDLGLSRIFNGKFQKQATRCAKAWKRRKAQIGEVVRKLKDADSWELLPTSLKKPSCAGRS